MEQERHLQILVNEGLLCKLGEYSYKFAHDEIFTASYSLIANVESMHLNIARGLLKNTPSPAELRDISFVVVDQFSRGISLVTDHTESIRIAEVCLVAGQKALSQSAFSPASIYLLQGCILLADRDWEGENYKLCLNLYQKCIEAQYVAIMKVFPRRSLQYWYMGEVSWTRFHPSSPTSNHLVVKGDTNWRLTPASAFSHNSG